jgi:hypothetical protein
MSFRLEGDAAGASQAAANASDLTAGVAVGLALQANLQAGQASDAVEETAEPAQQVERALQRSVTRSRVRRRPARVSRQRVATRVLAAGVGQAGLLAKPAPLEKDTNSELRDWIKDNASLLSNASLLISISAIALKALPSEGILNPYIQALIFAAAFILLLEMHNQWPDDLQLHMFRKAAFPQNHSRRMSAFAVLMQLATVLFAAWAALTNPLILFPLAAFGIILAFRQWYFRRFSGWPARILGVVAMIVVLILSEVLIAIAWAIATGSEFTIYFGDRPPT